MSLVARIKEVRWFERKRDLQDLTEEVAFKHLSEIFGLDSVIRKKELQTSYIPSMVVDIIITADHRPIIVDVDAVKEGFSLSLASYISANALREEVEDIKDLSESSPIVLKLTNADISDTVRKFYKEHNIPVASLGINSDITKRNLTRAFLDCGTGLPELTAKQEN